MIPIIQQLLGSDTSLNMVRELLTFSQNWGIGLVLLVIGVVAFIWWLKQVGLPAMKKRSELKLKQEQSRIDLEIAEQQARFDHEEQLREKQRDEQTLKLELAETMVTTSRGLAQVLHKIEGELSGQGSGIERIGRDVKGLVEKHREFETVTLKQAAIMRLEFERAAGLWNDEQYERLRDCLEAGLP